MAWRGDPEQANTLFLRWRRSFEGLAVFEDQVAAGLARDIAEVHLARGDLDAAWAQASVLLGAERLASAPWELPIAPVVARIIARRREASGDPLLQQEDAERLRAVIERDDWPTRPLWAAFAAAELGGTSGAGDDVGSWRAALDLAAAPGAEALTRLQLRWGLARAEVRQGDRVAAAETLGALARTRPISVRRSSWPGSTTWSVTPGSARTRPAPGNTPAANR